MDHRTVMDHPYAPYAADSGTPAHDEEKPGTPMLSAPALAVSRRSRPLEAGAASGGGDP